MEQIVYQKLCDVETNAWGAAGAWEVICICMSGKSFLGAILSIPLVLEKKEIVSAVGEIQMPSSLCLSVSETCCFDAGKWPRGSAGRTIYAEASIQQTTAATLYPPVRGEFWVFVCPIAR